MVEDQWEHRPAKVVPSLVCEDWLQGSEFFLFVLQLKAMLSLVLDQADWVTAATVAAPWALAAVPAVIPAVILAPQIAATLN